MAANSEKSFNVVAHGFSAGDALYFDGTWKKSQANSSSTLAEGIVTEVADADNFTAYILGGHFVTVTAHGLGSAGDTLYCSEASAGALTTSAPATGFIQVVGQVIDADTLALQSFRAKAAA
jgi:hypothetical protein